MKRPSRGKQATIAVATSSLVLGVGTFGVFNLIGDDRFGSYEVHTQPQAVGDVGDFGVQEATSSISLPPTENPSVSIPADEESGTTPSTSHVPTKTRKPPRPSSIPVTPSPSGELTPAEQPAPTADTSSAEPPAQPDTGSQTQPVPSETSQQLTIVPFGDALTIGRKNGAYRTSLHRELASQDLDFDIVGEFSAGPAALADKNHQGYDGASIDDLRKHVASLSPLKPRVVVVTAGYADVQSTTSLDDLEQQTAALMSDISAAVPNATVIFSLLPAPSDEAEPELRARVEQFNAAATKSAASNKIIVVKAATRLTSSQRGAQGMPTTAGFGVIGKDIAKAIVNRQ